VKIGITGDRGFIGSNVSQALTHAGHSVISLDILTCSSVFSDSDIVKYPKELDWVLHFGAKTSIPDSFADPYGTYANNIGSTLQALKIASHCHAAFLFMSSYVYGQPQYLPIDEKHPVKAVNPYMASKIIGEEMCRQICGIESIPAIILRGFNIFGDHYIPGRLISDLLHAVNKGDAIHLNDPVPVRDYIYIKDFTNLILKIIVQGSSAGICTYNVGYGKSYSNLEVAELMCELTNSKCELIVSSNPRKNDILDCSVDTSLIKDTFVWQPEYSLRRALTELINNTHDERKNGCDQHD
jgi:nucleoside-diphosphate-sugar epimerase